MMQHIERFLDVLKTESAILIVLLLALVAQIPHAASVFASVAHPADAHSAAWFVTWFGAITYAIALEAATLVFVLRGKWAVSAAFAGVSIAVNLCYYFAADGAWWAAALVSVALPLAIALYSHDLSGAHPQLPKLRPKLPKLRTEQTQTEQESDDAQPTIEQATAGGQPSIEDANAARNNAIEQRREKFLNILRSEGDIGTSEFAQRLDVSPNTVRNDRKALEERGLIAVNGHVEVLG